MIPFVGALFLGTIATAIVVHVARSDGLEEPTHLEMQCIAAHIIAISSGALWLRSAGFWFGVLGALLGAGLVLGVQHDFVCRRLPGWSVPEIRGVAWTGLAAIAFIAPLGTARWFIVLLAGLAMVDIGRQESPV